MALLTKKQIQKAKDLKTEDVPVPEWADEEEGMKPEEAFVRVRGLTGTERDRWEESITQQTGKTSKVVLTNFRARLCALCMVDEQGARLFSDAEIAVLGQKSAAALDRVYEVAARLSRITKEDVESLAKNSEPGRNGSSGSNSPSGTEELSTNSSET
jgi:hypothetical protein